MKLTWLEPTLFSFPSRHHPLHRDATYAVSFAAPTGLHPTMTISLSAAALAPPRGAGQQQQQQQASCALHAYLTLPAGVFADRHQLSTADGVFLASHRLVALRAFSGETDLEAPLWSVAPRWGSTWLLELATPDTTTTTTTVTTADWNVTIPLHLRYQLPASSGYRTAAVPWPVVFWACTADDGSKMAVNPFDRVNLGWDGLFGPRSMFYHLTPAGSRPSLVERISVPVLRATADLGLSSSSSSHFLAVELGTVAVVMLGVLWLLWKLGWAVLVQVGALASPAKEQLRRNKKTN